MFCYGCGAENDGNPKFCRGCGIGFETPAKKREVKPWLSGLAFFHSAVTPEDWLAKRGKGIGNTLSGAILLAASLFVLIGPYLFVHTRADWVSSWWILWTVFFSWMFMAGVFALATGIGAILESNSVLRGLKAGAIGYFGASTSPLGTADGGRGTLQPVLDPRALPAPTSIVESTTRLLENQPNKG
jgi:hypothetical protein